VVGSMTTLILGEAQRGAKQTLILGNTLANTTEPGAIDKQITGYDRVNQKDLVKTLNEVRTMYANAQAEEPCWINKSVVRLINKIEAGTVETGTDACE